MDYVPFAKNDDAVVTQYTMTAIEELGLLKMDFLGLRNLLCHRPRGRSWCAAGKRVFHGAVPEDDGGGVPHAFRGSV